MMISFRNLVMIRIDKFLKVQKFGQFNHQFEKL